MLAFFGLSNSSFKSFGFGLNQAMVSVDPTRQQAEHDLLSTCSWLSQNQNSYQLESVQTSSFAKHYQFVQFHLGYKVYGAFYKVNIAFDGTVLSKFNSFIPIHTVLSISTVNAFGSDQTLCFYWHKQSFKLLQYAKEKNALGEMEEILKDEKGSVVFTRMLDLFVKKDTLIKTTIFNPDPLTSAEKSYGQDGLWKHSNGLNTAELAGQMKVFSTTLKFSNDTFYAASPYLIMQDLESPSQKVFQSTHANFSFNRSQTEFREFNVLYHVETYRNYLKTIALPLTGMQAILTDPTAYQGQDQSRFSYSTLNPSLYYGTGGVPDAEDADVIIHEYTHGINYFLAPNTVNGNERLAIEEANCDFMACQYSKAISSYNWRWVFNWDGHNEFWSGRDANSTNVYPKDLSGDFYTSSLIWSSMLNDLSEDLGRDIITRLLLNSVYSYGNNMTMQDAADLLIQTDSLLNGYAHFNILKPRMVQRGFLVTGFGSAKELEKGLKLINSEGFAHGKGDLMLLNASNQLVSFEVLDVNGKCMLSSTKPKAQHQFSPNDFPIGIYFLKIKNESGSETVFKLMRLN